MGRDATTQGRIAPGVRGCPPNQRVIDIPALDTLMTRDPFPSREARMISQSSRDLDFSAVLSGLAFIVRAGRDFDHGIRTGSGGSGAPPAPMGIRRYAR